MARPGAAVLLLLTLLRLVPVVTVPSPRPHAHERGARAQAAPAQATSGTRPWSARAGSPRCPLQDVGHTGRTASIRNSADESVA